MNEQHEPSLVPSCGTVAVSEPAVIPCESPIVQKEGGNIACTALVPEEMTTCQSALIEWAKAKVASTRAEAAELKESYEHAKARKWKTGPLKRHSDLAADRVTFYEKMLSALEHGFVIVPNFPVSMFAVRKEGESPDGKTVLVKGNNYIPRYQQEPDAAPEGDGEYRNPFPHVQSYISHRDDHGNEITRAYPTAWDEMSFPVTMAKPEIMRAADRAMALKVFDQLGILPAETMAQKRAKGDPIIVGQIVGPKNAYGVRKTVTFMIAWHLDTRAL